VRNLDPRRRVIWAITTLIVVVASSAGCVTASGRGSASDPPGDLPGWRRVLVERFDGSRLNRSIWGAYSGQPGGDPGGWWHSSHVVVRGGLLRLETYRDARHGGRWVSGGVSSASGLEQRYGKYLVRFRMDDGFGVAGILLLWPQHGGWPPEIDFAETGGDSSGRPTLSATLHYGRSNHTIQRTVRGDFTTWHVLGVEWTPGRLGYTLDGRRWATVRSAHVPAQNMEMDMQTQAGTCGDRWAPCPNSTTPARVVMEVDWVAAYRPAPGSGATR
jgi:beta-glucanase (GH16 family)